mgnify:CR=1 FL=1
MARPIRITYPGAFYHITSRGNERKDVFRSQRDREKFLSYLQSATERYNAVIHAYCLMSNHYHMLLETPAGNLSEIMHHINGAYTTYFNVKRKRVGHLFQGRCKAILIEVDEYITELSRYIHLNPVRAGIVARPEEFVWSSYSDYIGQGSAPSWLKTDFILRYFAARTTDACKHYRSFVELMIGKECESPFKDTFGSSILGSQGFIEEITSNHLQEKEEDRNVPAFQKLKAKPALEEIIGGVKSIFGADDKLARQASIYVCHKYSGARLRELAGIFGIGDTAIIEASRRFSTKLAGDAKLRKEVEMAKGVLNK